MEALKTSASSRVIQTTKFVDSISMSTGAVREVHPLVASSATAFRPANPTELWVSSSNANDARVILIQYVDGDYKSHAVTALLTGQTPVQVVLPADIFRLNDAKILTENASPANDGDVYLNSENNHTIGVPDDLTVCFTKISSMHNHMGGMQGVVPVGYESVVLTLTTNARRGTNEPESICFLKAKLFGQAWVTHIVLQNEFANTAVQPFLYLPAKSEVMLMFFKASGAAETVSAHARIESLKLRG
jgi:hypothetical protein